MCNSGNTITDSNSETGKHTQCNHAKQKAEYEHKGRINSCYHGEKEWQLKTRTRCPPLLHKHVGTKLGQYRDTHTHYWIILEGMWKLKTCKDRIKLAACDDLIWERDSCNTAGTHYNLWLLICPLMRDYTRCSDIASCERLTQSHSSLWAESLCLPAKTEEINESFYSDFNRWILGNNLLWCLIVIDLCWYYNINKLYLQCVCTQITQLSLWSEDVFNTAGCSLSHSGCINQLAAVTMLIFKT